MLGPRWPQKPPVGTPIDLTHPIATGMVACVPLNEGTGLPSDCVRLLQASSNSGNWIETPYGHAVNFTGSPTAIGFPTKSASYTGPISFVALAQPSASLSGFARLATGGGWTAGATAGGTHDAPDYFDGATGGWVNGPSGVVDGAWHLFGFSHVTAATGGVQFYVDGKPKGTGSQLVYPTITSWLTGVGGSSGTYFVGPIALVMVWNRPLLAAEHAALAANPWQVFRPHRQATWSYLAASPPPQPGGPTGQPVVSGIGYRFAAAIVAASLAITVKLASTGATVPGTTAYNAGTLTATWTPTGGPLVRGALYTVTVAGATAQDGTPMQPVTFPFQVAAPSGGRWFTGLSRRLR